MAVDAATAAATTGTSSTLAGKARLADNFDTFLTLLTTQMKNQDPMSPMDSSQFTQQLVQMSGVEQQLLTNDLLKTLVNSSSNGIANAVSLIGKSVRAEGADTAIKGGKANWTYNLPSDAADVKIEVLDSSGKIIHAELASDNTAGDHAFTWNGKDTSGKQLADGGVYTLRVTPTDATGGSIAARTFVEGLVTAVEQSNGSTLLTINGGQVAWDKVTKVALDTAASTASTATTAAADTTTDTSTQTDAAAA
jgi:flagellar basal-body rod modification protein FlgD